MLAVAPPAGHRHEGVVYAVQGRAGFVKVGCSHLLAKRIRGLNRSSMGPVRPIGWVPGAFAVERKFHDILLPWRAHQFRSPAIDGATEWYWPTPGFVEALASLLGSTSAELGVTPFCTHCADHMAAEELTR